ncbi:unnamed protein product [Alopecurus aequalis]
MSSLIDIWTVELDRIRATRRAQEPFRPVAATLVRAVAQEGGHAARPDGRCSTTTRPDATADDGTSWSTNSSPSPVLVREDVFLSILVDCFGQ